MRHFWILAALAVVASLASAQTSITTINDTDVIRDSRGVINANFASLNTNKVEGAASSVADEPICFSGTGGKTAKQCVGIVPKTYTVATLPTPITGMLVWISDGANSSTCATGGGSTRVLCQYTGAAWSPAGSNVFGAENLVNAGRLVLVDSANTLKQADNTAQFASGVLSFNAGALAAAAGFSYGYQVANPAGSAAWRLGWSSAAYATGGTSLWLPNSTPFLYYPAASPFRIGTESGAATAYVSLDGSRVTLEEIRMRGISADPGSPSNGDIWYNTTTNKFRCRQGGATVDCIGSGGGSIAWELDGVSVGTQATVNVLTGTGIVSTLGVAASKITIQNDLDTTVGLTRAHNQTGGDIFCKPASASASAYTCALDATLTGYTEGMMLVFVPDVNSAAGAITVDVDSLGTKAIKQHDGSTDPGAAALTAGRPYFVTYDGTLFRMQPIPAGATNPPETKGLTIESPTATEDITLWFTDAAITISQMNAVVAGSTPSVTWTIRFASDRSAAGTEVVTSGTTTTSATTGSEVTSFNDATIPADSWIWLETTAQTGTVSQLAVTVKYTRD